MWWSILLKAHLVPICFHFFSPKSSFEKSQCPKPVWVTFWKKLRFGFVKRTRRMRKELRGPFWKKHVRVESNICWTLWAITKLSFNKSEDVLIFFLWCTQTPTQMHRTCKSTTTKMQIPPSTQHRPTITTQPPPPSLVKPPAHPPKLVKTTETQNTTKIKHDLQKIHKK